MDYTMEDYLNKDKKSIVDDTFIELNEKFKILSTEGRDWIKSKILWHISEAYERGRKNERELIEKETKFKNCR